MSLYRYFSPLVAKLCLCLCITFIAMPTAWSSSTVTQLSSTLPSNVTTNTVIYFSDGSYWIVTGGGWMGGGGPSQITLVNNNGAFSFQDNSTGFSASVNQISSTNLTNLTTTFPPNVTTNTILTTSDNRQWIVTGGGWFGGGGSAQVWLYSNNGQSIIEDNSTGFSASVNQIGVSSTPTCTSPQVLQNGVCVSPAPTCAYPQVLQNGVCVTSTPTFYSQTIGTIRLSSSTLTVGSTATASATTTSGLAVSISSMTPNVCTVSGSAVTFVTAGTCTLAANQSGNSSYSAAAQVTQTYSVAQPIITLTAQTIGAISFSSPTLTVGSTATLSSTDTSGLPVSLSSTTPSVCSVSGSTVAAIAAGTCTIAANQAGNATYSAATQVTQSITIGAGITNTNLFDYAAANYPSLFAGATTDGKYQQYSFRYYAGTQNYLAVDTFGIIFIMGTYTNGVVTPVGTVSSLADTITKWNAQAAAQAAASQLATSTLFAGTWSGSYGGSSLTFVATVNGNNLSVVIQQTGNTATGVISGHSASMYTSSVRGTGYFTVNLIDSMNGNYVQNSCYAASGYRCVIPNGTVITLTKLY